MNGLRGLLDRYRAFSARERILIACALALLALVLFSVLIVRPTLKNRSSAKARYTAAATTAGEVRRAAAAGSVVPSTDEPLRSLVTREANAAGLDVSRINAGEREVDVTFENAATGDFYRFAGRLSSEYGVIVSAATVSRSSEGPGIDVRATLRMAAL